MMHKGSLNPVVYLMRCNVFDCYFVLKFYYRKVNLQAGGGKIIYIWNLSAWFLWILSIVLVLYTLNSKNFYFFGESDALNSVVRLLGVFPFACQPYLARLDHGRRGFKWSKILQ